MAIYFYKMKITLERCLHIKKSKSDKTRYDIKNKLQVASDITLRNVLLDNIKHMFVKIMRNVMLYIHPFIYFL